MDAAQLWRFIIAAWAFVRDLNRGGDFCKADCGGLVTARLASPLTSKSTQTAGLIITPCVWPTFHSDRAQWEPFWDASLPNSSRICHFSPCPLWAPESKTPTTITGTSAFVFYTAILPDPGPSIVPIATGETHLAMQIRSGHTMVKPLLKIHPWPPIT